MNNIDTCILFQVYARSDPCDHLKPFYESLMKEVVDYWIKSVVFHITIPPCPRPRLADVSTLPYKQTACNKRGKIRIKMIVHTSLLQRSVCVCAGTLH